MDINKKDNNLIVTGLKDFNLHHIFDCGQCFRFNAVSENSYFGIANSPRRSGGRMPNELQSGERR